MANKTLAATIKEIIREHLDNNNGLLMGQCISAVGWVNGTVPETRGIIELPMTDVAGAGFAVGAAMVGCRVIFVVRFQDFMMLNGSQIINYAAKCKTLHGSAVPVFIRALASEGLGPVHSGVLHSIFMHFPGCKVYSPMTPGEYLSTWRDYMNGDDPMFVSEHRASFQRTEELQDVIHDHAEATVFGISATRFCIDEAVRKLSAEGIRCNVIHLYKLKPFVAEPVYVDALQNSKVGMVVDPGFEICGASRSIAYELSEVSGRFVKALGLRDATKCLCPPLQNAYASSNDIYYAVKGLLSHEAH